MHSFGTRFVEFTRGVSARLVLLALVAALAGMTTAVTTAADTPSAEKVRFKMHHVGKYRGEVCDVADFNNDKVLDIVAGDFIYLGPDFKPVKIRSIQTDINEEGKGYDWDFMNAPLDVDGDGLLDVVSCSWFGMQIEWYRNNWDLKNKKIGGELWPVTLVHKNGNYECGDLMDLDGDGRRQEIVPSTKATEWYEVGTGPDGKRASGASRSGCRRKQTYVWHRRRRRQWRRTPRYSATRRLVRSSQGYPHRHVEGTPTRCRRARGGKGRSYAANSRIRRECRWPQRYHHEHRPQLRDLLV